MNDSDKPKLATIIEGLAAMFRTEVTTPLLEGYWLGLSDLEYHDVRRAAVDAVRTCRFMPTAAELRERIHGGSANRALIAWPEVMAAVASVGGYRTVVFADPVTNAAVHNVGGWQRLCEADSNELDRFIRKDFEKAYAALAAHGMGNTKPHTGIFDRENGTHGFGTGDVVTVQTALPPVAGHKRLDGPRGEVAGVIVDLAERLAIGHEVPK